MPKEDQQKFVDNLTKFDTNALTVNTKVNEEEDMIAKPQANKSVSYTDSVKFFGAPVTTYRVSVNYSVTKGKVEKILCSSKLESCRQNRIKPRWQKCLGNR